MTASKLAEIRIDNIGSLSSLKTYTIGFKIAFDGNEFSGGDLQFYGTTAFGALTIYNWDGSSSVEVVETTQPLATQDAFQTIVNNDWSKLGTTYPTLLHTIPYADIGTATLFQNAVSSNKYGAAVGTDEVLFLKAKFDSSGGQMTNLSGATAQQAFVEIITHPILTAAAKDTGGWSQAKAVDNTNCAIYDNSGTILTGSNSAYNCEYRYVNEGMVGAEYTRIRWSAQTVSTFFSTVENHFAIYGVTLSKTNSLYKDDEDTAI